MTKSLVAVAVAIMSDQGGRHWGYGLMKSTGLRSGALYPILDRMLDSGWLTDDWEEQETARRKHVRRRYYELTDEGRVGLGAVLARAQSDARFRSFNLRWAT